MVAITNYSLRHKNKHTSHFLLSQAFKYFENEWRLPVEMEYGEIVKENNVWLMLVGVSN